MVIEQKGTFKRAFKKLHKNQKEEVEQAISYIAENPATGEEKKGDLAGVRVYKFHMINQLVLLAYTHEDETITLLDLDSHENFYRDLKN